MLRFAPSPTGDMHIGNLRVAIFNYIISRKLASKLQLRIEDTDSERNIEGKEREILEILDIFGISFEEKVIQSSNISTHKSAIKKLLDEDKAFKCFCTKEELEAKKEQAKREKKPYRYDGRCLEIPKSQDGAFVVRIKKSEKAISFEDEIKGECLFESDEIDSFVLSREDGSPTYNFACAYDDFSSNISLIIRGEDHLSNTPKQILIKRYLGESTLCRYAHLPIILNEEGKKMSKRDSASSVKWLLSEGFLPQAISNYLISIGNKTPCELFTIEEAIEWFELSSLSKSPAKFDLNYLRHINREHLKNIDALELSKKLAIDIEKIPLAKFYLQEASTTVELKSKLDEILAPKTPIDGFEREHDLLKSKILEMIESGDVAEEYEVLKSRLVESTNLKGKNLFKPLRKLLTNAEHGPELGELYPHIKNFLKEIII